MKPRFGITALVFCLSILALSCQATGLEVINPWARPAVAGQNSAVYFDVLNPTTTGDTLLSASSDAAEKVELHLSMMVEMEEGGESGGAMQMVPQESVEIPSDSSVIFQPGGLHVMLLDLRQDLVEGESFELTLNFEQAGEITLTVPIEMR